MDGQTTTLRPITVFAWVVAIVKARRGVCPPGERRKPSLAIALYTRYSILPFFSLLNLGVSCRRTIIRLCPAVHLLPIAVTPLCCASLRSPTIARLPPERRATFNRFHIPATSDGISTPVGKIKADRLNVAKMRLQDSGGEKVRVQIAEDVMRRRGPNFSTGPTVVFACTMCREHPNFRCEWLSRMLRWSGHHRQRPPGIRFTLRT